ncbi:hexuronate transporter [Salmonella enterica subsp. arizonae]|uniref:Hexuronate transporter n=1 Tax=Salmonella enterica subsp. arizonae TaxID=59203 RepID=A0A379ST60_SALER|nr:hexuronate transporter [Salmonella enterica subsp. arizonae]
MRVWQDQRQWLGQLSFNLFMGALVAIIGYGPFFIALSLFDIIGAHHSVGTD